MVELVCETCKTPFEGRPNRRYCGPACKGEARKLARGRQRQERHAAWLASMTPEERAFWESIPAGDWGGDIPMGEWTDLPVGDWTNDLPAEGWTNELPADWSNDLPADWGDEAAFKAWWASLPEWDFTDLKP